MTLLLAPADLGVAFRGIVRSEDGVFLTSCEMTSSSVEFHPGEKNSGKLKIVAASRKVEVSSTRSFRTSLSDLSVELSPEVEESVERKSGGSSGLLQGPIVRVPVSFLCSVYL